MVKSFSSTLGLVSVILAIAAAAVAQNRTAALVAALRPALPFPAASPDGEVPENNSADSRWFVVWPGDPDAERVVVKANPLHPEVQRASAEAMDRINEAVAAAERRAQAAYDKALAELRRTGRSADFETITLDDEGVAGERIDAELELSIEVQPVTAFEVTSGEPPVVSAGSRGATWTVWIPPNTYRHVSGADLREHFRPAELWVYFGAVAKPEVARKGEEPRYSIALPPVQNAFAVVYRGNETLLKQVSAAVDYAHLVPQPSAARAGTNRR